MGRFRRVRLRPELALPPRSARAELAVSERRARRRSLQQRPAASARVQPPALRRAEPVDARLAPFCAGPAGDTRRAPSALACVEESLGGGDLAAALRQREPGYGADKLSSMRAEYGRADDADRPQPAYRRPRFVV